MECFINFCTIVASIATIIGCFFAIRAYRFATKTYKANVEQTRVQATMAAFPQLRRENSELVLEIEDLQDRRDRELLLKNYMAQMERFAVGINCGAYDIAIVDKMSGGMLIGQYKRHLKKFIAHRQNDIEHLDVKKNNIYCEYEAMMRKLFALRGEPWED